MSAELGVADRDPAVAFRHDLSRGRLAVRAVVEARRLDDAGVAPAIEDDARDVAPRVEAAAREEPRHVPANQPLEIGVARLEQPFPSARNLLGHRLAGRVEAHVERQHRRIGRAHRRGRSTCDHRPPDIAREPEVVVEPPRTWRAERVQERPVVQRDVDDERGRVLEGPVRLSQIRRHVREHGARHRATGGHDDGACLRPIDLAAELVGDADVIAVGSRVRVLDAHDGRAQADARLLILAIERAEIEPAVVHAVETWRAGDRVRDQVLTKCRANVLLPPGNDCGSGPVRERTRATPGMPICDAANAETASGPAPLMSPTTGAM